MACADCFRGNIHEGTPKGEETTIHGLATYVAQPPQGTTASRGIIVIIPDAFGWKFGNNRLLADSYAEKGGYTVYLPDFMDGHAAPLSMFDNARAMMNTPSIFTKLYHIFFLIGDVVPFMWHCYPTKRSAAVTGFFEQLRKDEGATQSIGAAGFCWGGKHVVLLSHGAEIDGKPLIDAGFTAHPSFLSVPGEIEQLKRPVSFALAEKDDQIPPAKAAKLKEIVEALPGDAKGEAFVIAGTGHGFAVRADMNVDDVAAQAAQAEDQALAWFGKHFAK